MLHLQIYIVSLRVVKKKKKVSAVRAVYRWAVQWEITYSLRTGSEKCNMSLRSMESVLRLYDCSVYINVPSFP